MLTATKHSIRQIAAVSLPLLLLMGACKKKDDLSSLAGFTSFGFKDVSVDFTIDEATQKIYNEDSLPFQTDVSALVAAFAAVPYSTVTVGATEQVSGSTSNDFSSPVVYTVTAQDGNTKRTYTVQVNVALIDPNTVAWQQVTSDGGWGPFHSAATVKFNDKFWTIGGTNVGTVSTGIYTSTDGSSWTALSNPVDDLGSSIPIGENGTLMVFNSKLWILGGLSPDAGFTWGDVSNKTWSSTDGINWTASVPANTTDRWGKRYRISSVVFNNKLWAIGGNGYPSFGNTAYTGTAYGDIWSSADGTTWTEATADPGFLPRSNPAVFVYKDKIWIAGGKDNGSNYLNEIWTSSDGASWTQLNVTTPFTARFGHKVVVYNDELFLIGGEDASGVLNDMWVSDDDGVTWTMVDSENPRALPSGFPARKEFSCLVDDGTLWIFGGLGVLDANSKNTMLTDTWKGSLVK